MPFRTPQLAGAIFSAWLALEIVHVAEAACYSGGTVAGIAIGTAILVVLVIAIAIAACYIIRRKKQGQGLVKIEAKDTGNLEGGYDNNAFAASPQKAEEDAKAKGFGGYVQCKEFVAPATSANVQLEIEHNNKADPLNLAQTSQEGATGGVKKSKKSFDFKGLTKGLKMPKGIKFGRKHKRDLEIDSQVVIENPEPEDDTDENKINEENENPGPEADTKENKISEEPVGENNPTAENVDDTGRQPDESVTEAEAAVTPTDTEILEPESATIVTESDVIPETENFNGNIEEVDYYVNGVDDEPMDEVPLENGIDDNHARVHFEDEVNEEYTNDYDRDSMDDSHNLDKHQDTDNVIDSADMEPRDYNDLINKSASRHFDELHNHQEKIDVDKDLDEFDHSQISYEEEEVA